MNKRWFAETYTIHAFEIKELLNEERFLGQRTAANKLLRIIKYLTMDAMTAIPEEEMDRFEKTEIVVTLPLELEFIIQRSNIDELYTVNYHNEHSSFTRVIVYGLEA